MSNMSKDIQYATSDTYPPMLDRTDFESWQQRIHLYCMGKDNGENIMKSIVEGPYQMGTNRETLTGGVEGALQLGPEQDRVFTDLTQEEKDRYKVDIHATNIRLQGLPKDIYAKDIWDNVKMLLEGFELAKDDRESQLYDDFEHFSQNKGENIHSYYVRFTKLINDMRNIKITMPKMQLNLKFVNNMLPEWSRFITKVKLNSILIESNFDQLYAYLKQHEVHANENKMMLERFTQTTIDPLACHTPRRGLDRIRVRGQRGEDGGGLWRLLVACYGGGVGWEMMMMVVVTMWLSWWRWGSRGDDGAAGGDEDDGGSGGVDVTVAWWCGGHGGKEDEMVRRSRWGGGGGCTVMVAVVVKWQAWRPMVEMVGDEGRGAWRRVQYPTQSSVSPQSSHQPSPVDNSQNEAGFTPTDNLIESLTNTHALLTQSYKAHLPQTNNQLRTSYKQGTKLQFKMEELLFRMFMVDTMRIIKEDHFRGTMQEELLDLGMQEGSAELAI
ncbi:hypothetical protein Tco_1509234 [Tanacetum coccineum]